MTRAALEKSVEDFLKARFDRLGVATSRNYPAHAGHTVEEGEVRHFDAVFLEMDVHCSCGVKLVLTREMLDG